MSATIELQFSELRKLDLDIYTAGEFELGERVYRLGGRCINLDQTFVCTQLELLSRFLIYVRGTQDGKYFFLGGQRNRTRNNGSTIANSFNDFLRGLIDQVVVIRAKFNPNFLIHFPTKKIC